jgi:hypothetical protein
VKVVRERWWIRPTGKSVNDPTATLERSHSQTRILAGLDTDQFGKFGRDPS